MSDANIRREPAGPAGSLLFLLPLAGFWGWLQNRLYDTKASWFSEAVKEEDVEFVAGDDLSGKLKLSLIAELTQRVCLTNLRCPRQCKLIHPIPNMMPGITTGRIKRSAPKYLVSAML